jgi:cation transport ATPase
MFPAAFRGQDATIGVYFEASAVTTVLALLGHVLESRTRGRVRRDQNSSDSGAEESALADRI